ncbi:hypothetical protein Zmor_026423 [Zophobas morio]|uniref:Uncharacterized protein n=1 Tax=Zophobas morio TaxID=2755281 RepID=A0AA38HUB1_9CUCU|nr:hypothetical protein Zmor_026423 [Zophobas morio]
MHRYLCCDFDPDDLSDMLHPTITVRFDERNGPVETFRWNGLKRTEGVRPCRRWHCLDVTPTPINRELPFKVY